MKRIRKLYIEIAEKYGVVIEKIPLEGKKHLEKNDYILAKQAKEIANNEDRLQSLELKIEDIENFSEEVAKVAYEKACEVVTEEVRAMTIEEDVGIVEAYKGRVVSDKVGIKKENKPFAIKILERVVELLKRGKGAISKKIEKALTDPAQKRKIQTRLQALQKHLFWQSLRSKRSRLNLPSNRENRYLQRRRRNVCEVI